jgi:hypothetical protein
MRLIGEQKIGIIILMIGTVIVVGTQIMINKHGGLVHVNITPVEDEPWPDWKPLEYTQLDCPSYLIYQQDVGIVISTVGLTLFIRPLIFERERA